MILRDWDVICKPHSFQWNGRTNTKELLFSRKEQRCVSFPNGTLVMKIKIRTPIIRVKEDFR